MEENSTVQKRPFSYGVAWYPEWGPDGSWRKDLDQIADVGLNVVRIGEFAWDVLEPAPGRFDFGLYDEVMAELERRGIEVIFGVDTVRPPEWVFDLFPEIHLTDASGRFAPRRWPRHCFNHPAFQELSRRFIDTVIPRYQSNPAIRLYQVDNEPAYHGFGVDDVWFCYCRHCQREFRMWLDRRYQGRSTPELSNPFPQPGEMGDLAWLEWRLFHDNTVQRRTAWVIDQVRGHDSGRPITTNVMVRNGFGDNASQMAHDVHKLSRLLDVMGMDYYPDMRADGDESDALVYSISDQLAGGSGFECLETQATTFAVASGGWTGQEAGFYDFGPAEKIRPQFWRAVGHGAHSLLYWAWRLRADNVWSLTDPDGTLRPAVEQIRALSSAINTVWPRIGSARRPGASVAVAFNRASEHVGARQGLPGMSGKGVLHAFTAARRMVGTVDVVDLDCVDLDLSRFRAVIVPFLHVVPADTAQLLRRYVEKGGMLVWGGRGGACGEPDSGWTQVSIGSSMRIPTDLPLPADLEALLGYWRRGGVHRPGVRAVFRATTVDGGDWLVGALISNNAEVKARTDDGEPALLRTRTGNGVVWSTLVDPFAATDAGLVELLAEIFRDAGIPVESLAAGPDPGHEIIRRVVDDGELVFVINTSSRPWETQVRISGSRLRELLTDAPCIPVDGVVSLTVPARDACIVASD